MFNECCLDAMDYDDNFEIKLDYIKGELKASTSGSISSEPTNVDNIADRILQKIG